MRAPAVRLNIKIDRRWLKKKFLFFQFLFVSLVCPSLRMQRLKGSVTNGHKAPLRDRNWLESKSQSVRVASLVANLWLTEGVAVGGINHCEQSSKNGNYDGSALVPVLVLVVMPYKRGTIIAVEVWQIQLTYWLLRRSGDATDDDDFPKFVSPAVLFSTWFH